MLGRPLMLIGLLGAAVGVPYAMSNSSKVGGVFSGLFGNSTASNVNGDHTSLNPMLDIPAARSPVGPGKLLYPTLAVPLEGMPTIRLDEVFRFDITKEWVYGRWSRKSTAVSHAKWYGIRVPLVTGTSIDDLAGSLTYYFDPLTGRVQHISFHGRTGDTTRILHLVALKYKLERQPPSFPGEQLFRIKKGSKVQSELRTAPASVLWASSPHSSFSVDLELAVPGSSHFLPLHPLPVPIKRTTIAKPSVQPSADKSSVASHSDSVPDKSSKGKASADKAKGPVLRRYRWSP